jgi:hypothetical protein
MLWSSWPQEPDGSLLPAVLQAIMLAHEGQWLLQVMLLSLGAAQVGFACFRMLQ